GTVIHWYQQKEGKAPERLLYFSTGKPSVESGFQAGRYLVEKVSGQKRCVLTIRDVIPDDTATYYCAYWDPHRDRNSKIIKAKTPPPFPSYKGNSAPENSEILERKDENQAIYVCLIEKFYPDVIRVTWTDGQKEVTDNVVKGDPWKSTKEDKYSISSWLTVPKDKDKNYYCKHEHEGKQDSLSTQGIFHILKISFPVLFCPMFVTDHLMHRTAYLVYIVLLLKSSMYYLIVLFFIYR
ncbi:IGK protein, partial [Corythaeola cristata]|nr:IGK protein [Corythaeola cristata]